MSTTKYLLMASLLTAPYWASGQSNHMLTIQSNYSVKETVARLEAAIKAKGLNLFAVIDHAAAAQKAELELKPTTLLIFGNPKVGTLLMQSDQQMGIELPLKFLVTQNQEGETLISYKNPDVFAAEYNLSDKTEVIANVKKALAGLSAAAAE